MKINVRKRFQKRFSRYQEKIDVTDVILGSADGSVEVPGLPNAVYVRKNAESLPFIVYNFRVPKKPGLPVVIGVDPLQPKIRQVLTVNWSMLGLPGGADIPAHGHTHLIDDPAFISDAQIVTLLTYPTDGINIRVNAGYLVHFGQVIRVSTHDLDMTSHLPINGARYSLIRVDTLGALSVQDGIAVPVITDLAVTDIPVCEDGYAPIAFVRLYKNQTNFNADPGNPDIIPLIYGSGIFGGGGSVTTYAETIGDDLDDTFIINHKLDSTDVIVQLWDLTFSNPLLATGDADTITVQDANNIEIKFSDPPGEDAYRVVVLSV